MMAHTLCAAILIVQCLPPHDVAGFAANTRISAVNPRTRYVKNKTTSVAFPKESRRSSYSTTARTRTLRAEAVSAAPTGIGDMIGDRVASAIVNSPLYPILTRQARRTMKKCAEDIGVDWDGEVARLKAAQDWDAALKELLDNSFVEIPEYYRRPFHTYHEGNLCWEAAWEQHLASKAVGVRNFPEDGENGEHLLRKAYEEQMERLGVVVNDGSLVVDLGCGSGTSTRYLTKQFPKARKVVGFDLSPHMVIAGRFMAGEDQDADPRVELRYGDAAKTGLPDGSASLVSLSLVVHELASDARREIFREACRILTPGGSLAIMEMDPSAPGYVKLRKNAMLFSIIRSTEPYLEVYFNEAGELDTELLEAGFSAVRKSGATGRHMTVVAVKGGTLDLRGTDEEREKADTHVKSHKARVWIRNPITRKGR